MLKYIFFNKLNIAIALFIIASNAPARASTKNIETEWTELTYFRLSTSQNVNSWIQNHVLQKDRSDLTNILKEHLKKAIPPNILFNNKILFFSDESFVPQVFEYRKKDEEIRLYFNGLDVTREENESIQSWMKRSFRLEKKQLSSQLFNFIVPEANASLGWALAGFFIGGMVSSGSKNGGTAITSGPSSTEIAAALGSELDKRFINEKDREDKFLQLRGKVLSAISSGLNISCPLEAGKKYRGASFQTSFADKKLRFFSAPSNEISSVDLAITDQNSTAKSSLIANVATQSFVATGFENGRKIQSSTDLKVLYNSFENKQKQAGKREENLNLRKTLQKQANFNLDLAYKDTEFVQLQTDCRIGRQYIANRSSSKPRPIIGCSDCGAAVGYYKANCKDYKDRKPTTGPRLSRKLRDWEACEKAPNLPELKLNENNEDCDLYALQKSKFYKDIVATTTDNYLTRITPVIEELKENPITPFLNALTLAEYATTCCRTERCREVLVSESKVHAGKDKLPDVK